MLDDLQPNAVKAAQQRGASELACATATTQVVHREAIEEGATTGWYEIPRRAEYTVAVSGCGKRTAYLVSCDRWKKSCVANVAKSAPEGPKPAPRLADELQPRAVQTAQRRGSSDLACPAAIATVVRQDTIEEAQTTGWYEPPHHAVYEMDVSGCDKRTKYVVSCDDREKGDKACVAGAFQKAATRSAEPQLADELQPGAVKAAEQRGASELVCPAASATVLRKETIDEAQTTGWYEPPHRALYTMDVSGCGKRTSYLVACDHLRKGDKTCIASTLTSAAR